MYYTEEQLTKAQEAIEALAEAIEISPDRLVLFIGEGMESRSPIAGQLSDKYRYFLATMEERLY